MPIAQRNAVDNLMMLCPSCHSKIDKNSGLNYPLADLRRLKERHESWASALRRSGTTWNMRFHHIDFVNLPRIAMLPGGEELLQICNETGLDPGTSFRNQGARAGIFVNRARVIFENWGERAVDLDPSDPVQVKSGMLVSFDSPMRSHNVKRVLRAAPISGSIERDPHLRFSYDGRTVAIRFDHTGLTTMTSLVTLGTAEKEAVTYAGIGTVVAVTKKQIHISPLMFGQPENGSNNFIHFLMNTSNKGTNGIALKNMTDTRSSGGARIKRKNSMKERIDVVLYFDELHKDVINPESLQRATFSAILKTIPEHRRDLRIGWATLPTHALTEQGYTFNDIASHLLEPEPKHWNSFSIPRLGDVLSRTDIAYGLIRGAEVQHLNDLDEVLTEEFRPYRGSFQFLDGNRYHKYLHDCLDAFRISGSNLLALHSMADEYGDGLDESVIDTWTESGMFSSVTWEEDEARSRADEEQARELFRWL
jgi:hypothetical protein